MGNARNIAFWVVLFLLILALFKMLDPSATTSSTASVPYSDFIQRVDSGNVASVTVDGENLGVTASDGAKYSVIAPRDDKLVDRLIAKSVEVKAKSQEQSGIFSLISLWLPFIVLIGIWIFMMNRMQGGGKGGGDGLWQKPRQAVDRKARPCDL